MDIFEEASAHVASEKLAWDLLSFASDEEARKFVRKHAPSFTDDRLDDWPAVRAHIKKAGAQFGKSARTHAHATAIFFVSFGSRT